MDDFRGRPAHGRGISRRTVATGIAWSVPAVVVASAAPAYALSSASPSVGSATACKNPGGSCKTRPKGYSFFVTLCNPDPTDTIYMYGGTVTSIQLRDLVIAFLVPPVPFPIAPGGCVTVEYVASSNNSANFSFTVDVEVFWGHTPQPPDPDNHPPVAFSFVVDGSAPDCVCPAT